MEKNNLDEIVSQINKIITDKELKAYEVLEIAKRLEVDAMLSLVTNLMMEQFKAQVTDMVK